MSSNGDKLALRRQSIRALTADELRVAHGGANKTTHCYTAADTRCGRPQQTK